MDSITRCELEHYPGATSTERALFDHALLERALPHGSENRLSLTAPAKDSPSQLARQSASERPRRLSCGLEAPVSVDLRRFPGRDPLERAVHYLQSSVFGAERWSSEALSELARELLCKSNVIV